MTEYTETETGPEDTESTVLAALADGDPYVFVVTTFDLDGGIHLSLSVGNGVNNSEMVRSILEKTLAALPS